MPISPVSIRSIAKPPQPDPQKPTAVFLVAPSRAGPARAAVVQRMFPESFPELHLVNAPHVDSQSFGGREDLAAMKSSERLVSYFVNFCNSKCWAAKSYLSFGTEPIDEFTRLAERVLKSFQRGVFTSKLIFDRDNWLTRLLHNQAATRLQRQFICAACRWSSCR